MESGVRSVCFCDDFTIKRTIEFMHINSVEKGVTCWSFKLSPVPLSKIKTNLYSAKWLPMTLIPCLSFQTTLVIESVKTADMAKENKGVLSKHKSTIWQIKRKQGIIILRDMKTCKYIHKQNQRQRKLHSGTVFFIILASVYAYISVNHTLWWLTQIHTHCCMCACLRG